MAAKQTFPGGLDDLGATFDARRTPFDHHGETFPPPDPDLTELAREIVPASAADWTPDIVNTPLSWSRKRRLLAKEFIGNSQLSFLNAQLIANLRRQNSPPGTDDLFRRIWAEQADHLTGCLNLRWQVSSIITFADHGATPAQREAGQGFRMLFGMMKLYEAERLYSGLEPRQVWPVGKRVNADLPLDMDAYAIIGGGLEAALLAPVWRLARTDPVIAPLADHLMDALNRDRSTLFRRFTGMRVRLTAHRDARANARAK